MMHSIAYTGDTAQGYYHDPLNGQLNKTNDTQNQEAFGGALYAVPNAVTEWQPIRAQLGPQIANAPYGLDAKNPFIGVGYYHVQET